MNTKTKKIFKSVQNSVKILISSEILHEKFVLPSSMSVCNFIRLEIVLVWWTLLILLCMNICLCVANYIVCVCVYNMYVCLCNISWNKRFLRYTVPKVYGGEDWMYGWISICYNYISKKKEVLLIPKILILSSKDLNNLFVNWFRLISLLLISFQKENKNCFESIHTFLYLHTMFSLYGMAV